MNAGDGIDDLLPLPSATLHILLALAESERHGYAIIQDVEARTDGELRMSAGTLYLQVCSSGMRAHSYVPAIIANEPTP